MKISALEDILLNGDFSSVEQPSGSIAPYLRGPIPWAWLQKASLEGHSALFTGLAIWHLRALNKSTTFKASLGQLRKWTGLSEKSTRHGLHRLEQAQLVSVDRANGQSPNITLNAHQSCGGNDG